MATFRVPDVNPVTTFTFRGPRGRFGFRRKHTIPLVQHLPEETRNLWRGSIGRTTTKTLTEASAKKIWEAQVEVLYQFAPRLQRNLNDAQLLAIFQAWFDASGISVGESSASSTS